MKNLTEDIKKKSFQRVYLFYGEEEYLKQQYKQKMKEVLLPEGDTMNLTVYEGKSADPQEIMAQAETMPFFADYRLILVENSGFFKSGGGDLAEYVSRIPQETVLVFIEKEVDKRSRLYKAVKSGGRIVEFPRQDEKTLTRWILLSMKQEKKRITENAMQRFLSMAGNDMENIRSELEKLYGYTYGRTDITEEDVETVCTAQTTNRIFDMINAAAEKRQKRAMELYNDLLALKEPPMRILFLIARQFNQLMQVKELKSHGYDSGQIAKKLGIAPFIIKNALRQSSYFSLDALTESVKECVELEEAVKTGRINDQLSVELLLIKLSRRTERG